MERELRSFNSPIPLNDYSDFSSGKYLNFYIIIRRKILKIIYQNIIDSYLRPRYKKSTFISYSYSKFTPLKIIKIHNQLPCSYLYFI